MTFLRIIDKPFAWLHDRLHHSQPRTLRNLVLIGTMIYWPYMVGNVNRMPWWLWWGLFPVTFCVLFVALKSLFVLVDRVDQ